MRKYFYIFSVLFLLSCENEDNDPIAPVGTFWEQYEPWKVSYGTFNMPYATTYDATPIAFGTVALSETSGIAASRKNPGLIWAHNDSGHPNNLYLIDTATATIIATYVITGAVNTDWEDMEIVDDPATGVPLLYIANTGDNQQRKPSYDFFVLEEPLFEPSDSGKTIHLPSGVVTRHRFRYPNSSHDTEAMFVDPDNLDVYFVTKRDASSIVYILPFPYASGSEMNTAFKVGELGFKEASAASVSADGNRLVIKNRQDIFYWERTNQEPYFELLATTPIRLPYVGEPQGEAICFDAANNYFTLSEALNQQTQPTLYRYQLK